MILCMDNSSISFSFVTKHFLCASVKKKKSMLFRGGILFYQSSHMYLTYLYLKYLHSLIQFLKLYFD
ncbi:protein ycf2 [Phtheirospermum japonicum]|uniref:Protein ycf2 n=1 Tax=Phtheirospermum japonicum TaxID=374723 RepID=A0A830B4V5_9LAMI|nr:protein ycf2 [Phtheirospermum japonicum]